MAKQWFLVTWELVKMKNSQGPIKKLLLRRSWMEPGICMLISLPHDSHSSITSAVLENKNIKNSKNGNKQGMFLLPGNSKWTVS